MILTILVSHLRFQNQFLLCHGIGLSVIERNTQISTGQDATDSDHVDWYPLRTIFLRHFQKGRAMVVHTVRKDDHRTQNGLVLFLGQPFVQSIAQCGFPAQFGLGPGLTGQPIDMLGETQILDFSILLVSESEPGVLPRPIQNWTYLLDPAESLLVVTSVHASRKIHQVKQTQLTGVRFLRIEVWSGNQKKQKK